jgi:imidazolonepropionase-like amidohydrolase
MKASSCTAAGFLYRSHELGTLRPGLKADVVVLRGDPSRDIAAVRAVDRVMVGGRWVDIARYQKY